MQLKDLEKCARPVLFEHDHDEAPYWKAGSGFFVRHRKRLFFVTANHVMNACDVLALRVPTDQAGPDFLPFDGETLDANPMAKDHDVSDIRVFRVAESELDSDRLRSICSIDLAEFACSTAGLQIGDPLIIVGFPGYCNWIDYEAKQVHTKPIMLEGSYAGPDERDGLHIFKFSPPSWFESLKGMSGSSVFLRRRVDGGGSHGQLAGVLIQGDATGIGTFVTGDVLVQFLEASHDPKD